MVKDMKLFVLKLVDGHVELDTSKYQLSAGISTLGAVAVCLLRSKMTSQEADIPTQGQYPLLLLAQHLPVGKFYGALIVYIGLTALLVITCTEFAQIVALRYLI